MFKMLGLLCEGTVLLTEHMLSIRLPNHPSTQKY